jgi:hypothetical protein
MFLRSYGATAVATTLNIVLNALTRGRYVWLEGRVRRGGFKNWGRRFRFRPKAFAQPRTEEAIADLVRSSTRLRVFGAGHSFNAGVMTGETLVSLDRYTGILWKDRERKQMAVRGGTRIRDINRALLKEGWAFAALPSHDAQSIGGILSTDVHGTGRDWGFVSQSVASLKIVDGHGHVAECQPIDDLFKAAIGGIGAAGIIVEVVIQAVESFNVRQRSEVVDRTVVEANLDRLLEENDHLSLYVFPFSRKCQLNTWNRTADRRARLGPLREFVHHAFVALVSVWFADLLAHLRLLPKVSEFFLSRMRPADLVLESSDGFNRTLYYPHHELEFAVPYEETFPTLQRFIDLYEALYAQGLPFTAFELRFTPAGHERTLLGAGRARRSTWIDLLVNDSAGYERTLEAAEDLVKAVAARPHLGKHCDMVDCSYLQQVHGDSFTRFQQLVAEHDPHGKFANAFTRRLFVPHAG